MSSGGAVNLNLNFNLRRDVEPLELLKQLALSPLIYIRLAGILFSIIVFGCVADQVVGAFVINDFLSNCAYRGNSDACSFAIAVGVISFLICLTFLVRDVLYVIIDYSEAMVVKKVMVVVDAITNGLWGFMWFVCFCFTANERRLTVFQSNVPTSVVNCANSGVAFSFFNIFVFGAIVGLNVFYFFRLMRGAENQTGGGYASFPEPSGGGDTGPSSSDYTPPEY